MIQPQIVEYTKAQLGVGVSEEVIRSALVEVGWPVQDVEESLKSVAPTKVAFRASAIPSASTSRQSDATASQVINLKELFGVSSVERNISIASVATSSPESNVKIHTKTPLESPKKTVIFTKVFKGATKTVILGVLVCVAAGAAIYFYFGNRNLTDRVGLLMAENSSLRTEVEGVATKMTELNKAKQEAEAQAAAAAKEAEELHAELGFFLAPPIVPGVSASAPISFILSGVLAVDEKGQYSLTSANGLKVLIKNSKEQKIDAVLRPLVGETIEISGTHAPLSREVLVSKVNGEFF